VNRVKTTASGQTESQENSSFEMKKRIFYIKTDDLL